MTAVTTVVDLFRAPPRNGTSGWRFSLLALAIVGVGALMIWRLVSLQVLEPERYIAHGENQRIRSSDIFAERGSIVDRQGVELAVSVPRTSISADPRLITDPAGTAEAIVAIAGGNVEQLTRRLSNPDAKFAWMARQVDDGVAAAILDLDLPGIYGKQEHARLTPSGSDVARGILGRTDIDGNGVSGLERQYDEALEGVNGSVVVERGLATSDAKAVTIPDGRYEVVAPVRGDSLVLTIDRTVQFEVERLLERTVAESDSASGTVIVSRPRTGEILAMASVIQTDDGSVSVSSSNLALTSVIEPGSISKPLAMAALLEEELISPETQIEVTDEIEIYDRVFTDSVRHETSVLSAREVLESSSNVGMALLSDRLGKQRMHEYLGDFGIGAPTVLEFPGESSGIFHPVETWSGVALPSAAIGYGFAATPLQMLRAYNVFANGGVLVEPHLVSGIMGDNGDFTILSPRDNRRVISEDTADTVSELLAGVVRDGTGRLASIEGYEIAGKTGTARIAQPAGGYEDENGEVHLRTSFAGYLPAADPELSVIVVIEDPAGESSGGRLAAPLFGEISNFALQHFRIPPASRTVGALNG
ncbi:MAG: peptidoglycan D,D-transpeptidase FtsI family protein [Acidimicrobiales bacterium]